MMYAGDVDGMDGIQESDYEKGTAPNLEGIAPNLGDYGYLRYDVNFDGSVTDADYIESLLENRGQQSPVQENPAPKN